MEKEQICCIEASLVDRISDLPDAILHQILSYLPARAMARTSVLSKRWQYLWDTYPIFDFPKLPFLVFGKGIDLERYVDFVDRKLNSFCKYKFQMQKFELSFSCIEPKHDSLVDKWLRLVSERHVKELYLDFSIRDRSSYRLPREIFAATSLTSLVIYCVNGLLPSSIKLPSLLTLRLYWVLIPEEFKLSCHQLKELAIIECQQFGKIEIFAPNLSSMSYHSNLLPTSSFLSLNGPLKLNEFTLSSGSRFNTSWYINLKQSLLQMRTRTETLCLLFDSEEKNSFNRGEASKSCHSPQYALKCLALKVFHPTTTLDFEALIDGFLWSFHPEILSVMFIGSDIQCFYEVLFKTLEGREVQVQDCCRSSNGKCWRHSFKVKHVIAKTEGSAEKAPLSYDALLKAAYEEIKHVDFYLTW